jgi:hypothetical protein
MKSIIAFALLLSFAIPFVSFSQGTETGTNDEVLLAIPTEQFELAARSVVMPLRVYQRLFEYVLVGTDRVSMMRLGRRGIRYLVVDDEPWTEAYAVVSSRTKAGSERSYAGTSLRILHRVEDFDILKGSVQTFDRLRQEGYTCVEIERKEVPVNLARTHLPPPSSHAILDSISTIISLVSDTSIYNYIAGLANLGTRHWNNVNRDSVSRYVRARYQELGMSDVVLDSFQYSSTWQANVVATLPGTSNPTAEIIVGGHHDDMPASGLAPGADDNASGTSAVLEMARVLKLVNYRPAYTIRFMGFAAEEAGLRGSASYAQRARQANRDIRAMQNYDMIGYRKSGQYDTTNIVWYQGAEALANLHAATSLTYASLTPYITSNQRTGSDSYSFYQQGYNAVFAIEHHFSPYYHTSNDLLQYLVMPFASKVVKSGLAMLLTLDQMPPSVPNIVVRDWGDGTSLYAAWDSVSVLDWYRYKVYVGRASGVYDSSMTQTARSRRIGGLTAGTRYYVGVSIVDMVGREGMIVEQPRVPRSVPLPPAGLTVSSIPHGAKLRWRSNGEMDMRGYNAYRSVGNPTSFTKTNAQLLSDTTWSDTNATSGMYYYFVTAVDSSTNESAGSDTVSFGPVDVPPSGSGLTFEFKLHQNYPNPFNPVTEVRYEVAQTSRVSLKVFDLLGREVATLVDAVKLPGIYNEYWDAHEMSSGVYVVTLKAGAYTQSKRMLLLK